MPGRHRGQVARINDPSVTAIHDRRQGRSVVSLNVSGGIECFMFRKDRPIRTTDKVITNFTRITFGNGGQCLNGFCCSNASSPEACQSRKIADIRLLRSAIRERKARSARST